MIRSERVGDVCPPAGHDMDFVMPERPVDDCVREKGLVGNGAARFVDHELNLELLVVANPGSPEPQRC